MRAQDDLRTCNRCGLRVSAGACDTPPLVFHTKPEDCIAALRKQVDDLWESLDSVCEDCQDRRMDCGLTWDDHAGM